MGEGTATFHPPPPEQRPKPTFGEAGVNEDANTCNTPKKSSIIPWFATIVNKHLGKFGWGLSAQFRDFPAHF
jgi:hypothetical protein